MKDTNITTQVGRLTREADLKYLQSGTAVLEFSIANNYSKKDSSGNWVDETNYFDVSYFGKGAEAVSKYIAKGKQVCVVGSLRQERWEKDGDKRSKVKIMADTVQLLGSKGDSAPAEHAPKTADDFESEIPF